MKDTQLQKKIPERIGYTFGKKTILNVAFILI